MHWILKIMRCGISDTYAEEGSLDNCPINKLVT